MQRLTFEEFRRTRRYSQDLRACENLWWEATGGPASGFVYLDRLCIKELSDGKYHLTVGEDELVCDKLELLEWRLFEFAQGKGYTSETVH